MKKQLIIVFLLLPVLSIGQTDTTFYFGANGRIANSSEWRIKKEISRQSAKKIQVKTIQQELKDETVLYTEKIKIVDDATFEIKIKGDFFSGAVKRIYKKQNDGTYSFTDFQDGVLKRTGKTSRKVPLLLEDKIVEFYKNGNKKSESLYKNNELKSNKSWLENGEPYISNVFYSVDKDPLFPDGMGRLHQHILEVFSNSGLDLSQVSGKIKVGFVVMENGSIDGIRIEEGINSTLNSLALGAFKTLLGKWTPAVLDGEKVRCFQLFPINFIYRDYDYDYVDLRGGMLYWEIN